MLIRIFFLFLVSLSPFTLASPIQQDVAPSTLEKIKQHDEVLEIITRDLKLIVQNIHNLDSSINDANGKAEIQSQALKTEINRLEEKLSEYENEIELLKARRVNDSLGMNFSVWTGILLASVAVIVTTLGVVIAIGSVFGYKKIMTSSREEAERVARDEANLVAKTEVAERIDRGEFNDLVVEAVDRVAFGNINSNNELDEEIERS